MKMNVRTFFVILAGLALVSLSSGLVFSGSPAFAKHDTGPARGKVLFDMSHREIFSPLNDGPLHYSAFFKSLKSFGLDGGINPHEVNSRFLDKANIYVVAGPTREFTPDEIRALTDFVATGGNLLVLLHISQPVARLTEAFGILVSNFVISDRENTIEGRSQDFLAKRFVPHPVTSGLGGIAFFGTWGLLPLEGAKGVAFSSEKAWADMNRNRTFDKGEPEGEFALVAVSEYGRGKVVVVADDAPFANTFYNMANNKSFADNIIKWFVGEASI